MVYIFQEATRALVNSEEVYHITYWNNRQRKDDMCLPESLEDDVASLSLGDAFILLRDENYDVSAVKKIFSPGTAAIPFGTDFDNYINIEGLDNFKMLGDTSSDAESEVYFGYITKVNSAVDSYIRVNMTDESGLAAVPHSQSVNVNPTANIMYYNSFFSSESKKLKVATTSDITASYFFKTYSGDIDFANSMLDEMSYGFVKVNKGVAVDFIIVRYARD